ncbi:hypothetical protein [Aeromonas caviae]|uniref:hypothetical protein n=1 Tax=Aeromonas caviae TaxID=648 RepID=UPI0038CF2E42
MFELIEKAMAHLQSGNYAILIAVIIASLIYKSLPLLDAYHSHRKHRVTDLENAFKSECISPLFQNNLKEEIECEHFKIIYGVKAKKNLIDQVFMLHSKLEGEKTLDQFSNALRLRPKVVKSNGSYRFKVGIIDYFFGFYHFMFGVLFLAIAYLELPSKLEIHSIFVDARPLASPLIMATIGVIMLYLSTPIFSLISINRAIKTRI